LTAFLAATFTFFLLVSPFLMTFLVAKTKKGAGFANKKSKETKYS